MKNKAQFLAEMIDKFENLLIIFKLFYFLNNSLFFIVFYEFFWKKDTF